jgi:modulator of FtsH protease
MSQNFQTVDFTQAGGMSAQRHAVLRNTYWLLALSMLPTIAGAWLGVATGASTFLQGFVGLGIFMVGAYGFIFAINKTKNSAAGVPVLLAFTFFMGLMLSSLIGHVLHNYTNGAALVMKAFGGTAGVFFTMAMLVSVIKRDLSGMGKWLFVGSLVVLASAIMTFFFASTMFVAVVSALMVGLFTAYMLYDLKRILDGGETNYITATLSLYLDIYNVFQGLLSLLGIFGGERD